MDETPADSGAPETVTGGEQQSAPREQTAQENQIQALTRKLRKYEQQEAARLKAEQERQAAEMSEVDKLRHRLTELEQERERLVATHRQQTMQHRFEAAARAAGALNPTAAWKLADVGSLDLDESGQVVGLDAALASLRKSDPYLFAPPPVQSAGGNPPGGNGAPRLTPEAIRTMSREDFAKLQDQLKSGALKI